MLFGMKKPQVYMLSFFTLLLIIVWSAVFLIGSSQGDLTVAFLDIGQGDAIYIEAPNGTQVLIDGGPNKSILRELGKVMPFWDRSIDVVMMSHPDLDHIGGLPAVFERFSVEYFVTPGVDSDTGAYQTLVSDVEKEKAQTILARRGRIWLDQEHGVYIDILFPDRDVQGVESNLASIVVKLVYGDTAFLFTGDSPQAIEKYLATSYKEGLDVDVLKLGHHGSKTSSSEIFLEYTSPEYAIISAGEDNKYGHPHQEVLDLLNDLKIFYLNTAQEGRIELKSNGVKVVRK